MFGQFGKTSRNRPPGGEPTPVQPDKITPECMLYQRQFGHSGGGLSAGTGSRSWIRKNSDGSPLTG